MTDKTDALLALLALLKRARDKLDCYYKHTAGEYPGGEPNQTLFPALDKALAEQPAGAAGEDALDRAKDAVAGLVHAGNCRVWEYGASEERCECGLFEAKQLVASLSTAPPAASVDVDCLKQIRALLQSLPDAQGREHIDLGIRLNRMIDSAGGAKGGDAHDVPFATVQRVVRALSWMGVATPESQEEQAARAVQLIGWLCDAVLQEANTPQPDGGDRAVYQLNAGDNFWFDTDRTCYDACPTGEKRVVYARPSAAAAVPEGFVLVPTNDLEAAIAAAQKADFPNTSDLAGRLCGYLLAAAPAAPKGGVIPLNDDTIDILGRPNFACRNIAIVLRAGGADIPTRSENEQAATIAYLLNHYLANPKEWRSEATKDLQAKAAALATPRDEQGGQEVGNG